MHRHNIIDYLTCISALKWTKELHYCNNQVANCFYGRKVSEILFHLYSSFRSFKELVGRVIDNSNLILQSDGEEGGVIVPGDMISNLNKSPTAPSQQLPRSIQPPNDFSIANPWSYRQFDCETRIPQKVVQKGIRKKCHPIILAISPKSQYDRESLSSLPRIALVYPSDYNKDIKDIYLYQSCGL